MQHDLAAEQLDVCMHHALAIISKLMKRAIGAERLLVELDGVDSTLDADMRLDRRWVGSERHDGLTDPRPAAPDLPGSP